ncbi:hypothetical protein [Syntrophobacter fumaroxidans]|uniref:Uncharacterized protein n=1 Tax=Syntrophobacter fumaroxidans (strain DSM 10017 / MPOB) TaxID=335543 RepID=A0LGN3_SYNFM|nr:hypothetical protein [Syntrophobacter fumaroxidans]ABK16585.1 hypothetical protein Sfum_0888 [Syntrophobacter fumaroxidans MPOB]
MSLNDFADSRFSPYTMRRRPISGPIARMLFRGIVLALGTGSGVTVLLCFTTGSPLSGLENPTGSELGIVSLLLSPYLGMFLAAWLLIGSGIWRGAALLIGSAAVSGFGLFNVVKYWTIVPRPIPEKALTAFPLEQWALVGITLVLALVPGLLMRFGMNAFLKLRSEQKTAVGPEPGTEGKGWPP